MNYLQWKLEIIKGQLFTMSSDYICVIFGLYRIGNIERCPWSLPFYTNLYGLNDSSTSFWSIQVVIKLIGSNDYYAFWLLDRPIHQKCRIDSLKRLTSLLFFTLLVVSQLRNWKNMLQKIVARIINNGTYDW